MNVPVCEAVGYGISTSLKLSSLALNVVIEDDVVPIAAEFEELYEP